MKDLRKVESPGVSEMIEKKRRLTTWLVIGIGSLVLVVAGFASKDKAVEWWYLSKLKSEDREEQRTAIQKLGEMRSASAAPRLVELFREQNTRLSFGRDDLRLRAALVAIGEPSVPHLIELTRDRRPAVRSAAWTVLGQAGTAALAHLLDEEDRVRVLRDLSALGARADEAPRELIHACADVNPRVRAAAITAIGTVAPEFPSTIDALLGALEDEDDTVRFAAAVQLGESSDPRAKVAVPELVSAVMEEFLDRRAPKSGTDALSHLLENLDHPVPPDLIHACSDASPRVRAAALAAIATVAPGSHATIETLLSALKDKDRSVRLTAADRLGGLSDPRAAVAVPVLLSAVSDESIERHRRIKAAGLLGKHRSAAAVPALIEALNREDLHFVGVACGALGEIGPPARDAIPVLEKLAKKEGYIGQQAIRALKAIQSEDVKPNEQR